MTLFQAALIAAALLCSLVAGLLFAFAVVVMPGIRRLADAEFIRAFQVIDGVIQKNQPLFAIVWVGSILTLLTATVLGVWELRGADRLLAIAAALVYLVGVQLPTFAVNIPLNNELQELDPGAMDAQARKHARDAFEPRWNHWNAIRATFACLTSLLLLSLLLSM
ncbi:MAG: anthrone oxygenase family protein [Myxococcaceae bacterium]